MEFSALNIISVLIPFEALLFTIYILSLKVEHKISNVFIALFIFESGLESIMPFLYENVFITYPQFALILDTLFFLQLPLLYLYIKSTLFKDFELRKTDLLHLVPILIVNLIALFNYHILPLESKKAILTGGMRDLQGLVYITYAVLVLQLVIYAFLSFKEINKYKQIVKENYSDIGKYNYRWIRQLLFAFVFILVVSVIKNFAWSFIMPELHEKLFLFLNVSVLVFITWIIYKALKRPYLFSSLNSQIKLIKELIQEKEMMDKANDKNQLTNEEKKLLEKLENHMAEEKPFLEPTLTLHDLAMQLKTSTRELSVLINKTYKKHYFDFVNSYRIGEAITILLNPSTEKLTVLEIMYDVGFNSKSSFNSAFKKHTGITPTAYKKRHSKSTR